MSMTDLLNLSVNETLARTFMTSFTTLLALFALAAFGGEVIRGFCIALIWGIVIGTYSTIYLAVPALLWTGVTPVGVRSDAGDGGEDGNLPATT